MRIGSFTKTVRLSEIGQIAIAPSFLAKSAPATAFWQPGVDFSAAFAWERPDQSKLRSDRDKFETGVVTLTDISGRARPVGWNAHKLDPNARQLEFCPNLRVTGKPGQIQRTTLVPLDRFIKQTVSEIRAVATGAQKRQYDGTAVVLGSAVADSGNFFHFWTDIICDIEFFKHCGIRVSDADHILMPWTGARWQQDIAALCGIPVEKIVPLTASRFFRFKELYAAQRMQSALITADWCVAGMRNQARWDADRARPQHRKIFVTRGTSARRAILNEPELVELAAQYGYQAIDCGKLTVAEQQDLFASAAAIVGPHGAGFTNIAWCQPKTVLLEFINPSWTVPCFYDMAQLAGVNYMNVLTTPVRGQKIWTESVLDIDTFRRALNWIEDQL